MKKVLQRYKAIFDELNVLETRLPKETTQKAVNDFVDFLIEAYVEGLAGVSYILGEDLHLNHELLSAAINKVYDGESILEKFTTYHSNGDVSKLQCLIESEVHRVYNLGGYDGASSSQQKVFKQWLTVGDDKVRDTHVYLEGASVPLHEVFTTNDGDFALAPGGFTKAENNVNCRCILQYSIQ